MCGRFTQRYTWSEVHAFLSVIGAAKNLRPRYNIAPTTTIDVVRLAESGRELVSMRWGLIPVWWKKPLKEVPATFNARAETVAEKPMFHDAFKRRRCIIPASGFFEWTGGKGEKVPHLFTAADGAPVLAFAGLWDRWTDPASGDEVLSATIIVSGASEWMTPYHDRMPVLLGAEDFDGWLDATLGPEALKPVAEEALREWIVSSRVTAQVMATTTRRSWNRSPRWGDPATPSRIDRERRPDRNRSCPDDPAGKFLAERLKLRAVKPVALANVSAGAPQGVAD